MEAQQQADQAHAKFDDEKSEFTGYLRLWKWLHDARGGKVVAQSRKEMAAQNASFNNLLSYTLENANPKSGSSYRSSEFNFRVNPMEMDYAPLKLTLSYHF